MGFWSKTFTWWNGATWGTALLTRRFGNEVGRDEAGNVYYQRQEAARAALGDLQRRQRRQPGPAGLAAWLRGTIDDLPDKALPPVRKFQQKPTGEPDRDDGGLPARRRAWQRASSGRHRPAITSRGSPNKREHGSPHPLLIALALAACGRGAEQQNASAPADGKAPATAAAARPA